MPVITVTLNQVDDATTKAHIRDHNIMIDRPESKGGHDAGAMGGELVLAALGGCFNSNLLAAIKARDVTSLLMILRLKSVATLLMLLHALTQLKWLLNPHMQTVMSYKNLLLSQNGVASSPIRLRVALI